ncbi:hypothetical protein R1sor_012073 [Riccia sorocarpa]|uniref:Uncharacterized protein n=1 Tax=Riccia sorocarpa TaxID=122646 RepID=A0ABD3I2R6_9MARC
MGAVAVETGHVTDGGSPVGAVEDCGGVIGFGAARAADVDVVGVGVIQGSGRKSGALVVDMELTAGLTGRVAGGLYVAALK